MTDPRPGEPAAQLGELGEQAVGKWIAEGRELPVENCRDACFAGSEDHIVAAIVAVNDPCFAAVGRQIVPQPADQPVHRFHAAGLDIALILLRPARHLTLDEPGGLAIVAKPDRCWIIAVQLRDRGVHRVEMGGALIRRHVRKCGLPDDPSVNQVHHEKGCADNALVLTQPMNARDWEGLGTERAHHPRFAFDRMGSGQQLAWGLAAKDEGLA